MCTFIVNSQIFVPHFDVMSILHIFLVVLGGRSLWPTVLKHAKIIFFGGFFFGAYSQNSMTGEVAFSRAPTELFLVWNVTQEPWITEGFKCMTPDDTFRRGRGLTFVVWKGAAHPCSRCCCTRPMVGPSWKSWTGRRWPRLTRRRSRCSAGPRSLEWHNPLLQKKKAYNVKETSGLGLLQ